ncbi:MAG: AmmeMemoRadiSam system radical SAM enzyme [Sedimentisphaerales bacterium]|nr:AmmeMemoRadiSam system radical SAM enzyme [Sedimentisphaerales bacterium]
MLVQCELCPKSCVMEPGQSGECRVRVNIEGRLCSVVYGYPCSIHIDPIEKKPLNHFFPGSDILSVATVGCNLHCRNCQNWEISQANPEESRAIKMEPEKLVQLSQGYKCPSLAFTYTDPIVYYEYTLDTARLARAAGLRNVLVTAGYINPEPWQKLLEWVDAANIDLKSISDVFYRDICQATLKPVQQALVQAKAMGVWVEVTNLVIPTLNDSDEELTQLSRWVKENMGRDTPLHFSRFSPRHELRNLPATPGQTLEKARLIAKGEGLDYVYIGNILSPEGQNTYCPGCGTELIVRKGYQITKNDVKDNRCQVCQHGIAGVWQ